jgi:lipopolysaccharide/colanic/teichoic acid biosynthesis glycosyltransferase
VKRAVNVVRSLLILLGLLPTWTCVIPLIVIESPGNLVFARSELVVGGTSLFFLSSGA